MNAYQFFVLACCCSETHDRNLRLCYDVRLQLQVGENFSKENVLSPKDVKELLDILKNSDLSLPTYTLW